MQSNKDVLDAANDQTDNECYKYLEGEILKKTPSRHFYAKRKYRYGLFSLNYFTQECYSEDEIKLVGDIEKHYHNLPDRKDDANYFKLTEASSLFGFKQCNTPSNTQLQQHIDSNSFTLNIPDAKDDRLYPIWNLADSNAKRIANWQSSRIYNQSKSLMNDPAMLVLEELKSWFIFSLAQSECNANSIEKISARRNYIKNLIYLLPDFGQDRLYLHELQSTLLNANSHISNCIANREIPELLSDLIRSTKNLENILSSYLHFILIDEPVSDNFTPDIINEGHTECQSSPLCKIYNKALKQPRHNALSLNTNLFTLNAISLQSQEAANTLVVDTALFSDIKFADFITIQDKNNYIKAVTMLNILAGVRGTLEEFRDIQSKIGTFTFATSFLDKTNELTNHYLKLLEQTNIVVKKLITTADRGLKRTLHSPKGAHTSPHFENNLRSLETKIAGETTITEKFDRYNTQVIENTHRYQLALKKLAAGVQNGQQQQKLNTQVRQLLSRINQYNDAIPAIINDDDIIIRNNNELNLLSNEHSTIDSKSDASVFSSCIPSAVTNNQRGFGGPYDRFRWDDTYYAHSQTGEPVYTLRAYLGEAEVGSIEFYGEARLCYSNDYSRNNILNLDGIFIKAELIVEPENQIICRSLPPSYLSKIIAHCVDSGILGLSRGLSTALGEKLYSDKFSKTKSIAASQFAFVALSISYKVASNYIISGQDDLLTTLINAVVDTGSLLMVNTAVSSLTTLLNSAANQCEQYNLTSMRNLLHGASAISWYGLFFYTGYNQGPVTATLSTLSGVAGEKIAHTGASYFFGL